MTGATPPSSVFVAYPWSPYDRDDYKSRYRQLERKHGVAFGFAEDRLTSEHLIAKIEAMMTAADFCIFDLTDLNPNVMLEYGIARGLRLESYIAFNPNVGHRDVPSDLKGLDSLRYASLDELGERLDAFLTQAMATEERRRRGRKSQLPTRDQEQFDEELARVPRSAIMTKIDSRGHWFTRIRPERYEPGRIEFRKLMEIIGEAKVRRRSYEFPHTDTFNQFPELGLDWYGREFDLGSFKESWYFFQSGQFVQRRAIPEDWPEEWTQPVPSALVSLKSLMPGGVAAHIVETFEFASRLASAIPGSDSTVIRLAASPMAGRELFATASLEDPFLEFAVRNRRTVMAAFRFEHAYPRDELRRDWTALAIALARDFFDRFGFNAEDSRLHHWGNLPPPQI